MNALDTLTVQNLLDQSQDQDTHKADFTSPARSFQFDQSSRIIPQVEAGLFGQTASVSSLAPTPWAWSQIFSKLGPTVYGKDKNKSLPSDYLLALRPEQRAELLNDHLQHTDTNWLVRSYDDTARAVLSDRYTAINNSDLLDILNQISNGTQQPHHLTRNSSVTPDSLNVRIIWKNIDTGDDSHGNGSWGIGTYVRNGETGNRKGGILPLVQRHSCQNSIIIDNGKSGYEFLHLGSLSSKLTLVKAAISDVLPFAAHLLDKLIKADGEKIPDFTDVISGLCKQYNWDEDVKLKIATGTEGRDTRAGLVNGVTYVANFIEDPDRKADFQIAGGAILLAPDSVFHTAVRIAREAR